ncbi:MAG: glycosyltransferase family 4 protein [Cyanobacteria bacterium J06649_4]
MNVVGLSSTTNTYIQARWSAFFEENPEYSFSHIEFGRVSKVYDWKPTKVDVSYPRIVLSDKPSQYESIKQLFGLIRALFSALDRISPDIVVLNGYQQPATLAALVWSKLHRKPTILLSESKEDDAPRRWLSETIKRGLVSTYQSALVGGRRHKDYLVKLGMNNDAIFLGHNIVGNEAYHPSRISHLPSPLETKKPFFLAINRFITKKNIPTILSAYAQYVKKQTHQATAESAVEPWDLILCGDGALRPQIETQIKSLDLEKRVHLPGFLQPDELLPYFAHASCFVHASTQEQWGLVVNEAMAAGLPAIVSRCCGCFDELVVEGITGFGFDANSPQELAALMAKVGAPDAALETMSQNTLTHIEKFGPSLFSRSLRKAIQHTLTPNSKYSA